MCAARLKKEKVAITACENATALRASEAAASSAPPPPPPLTLLMAKGEASLFADEPLAAREHFRAAARRAADGDALRQEKEARDALRRAEGRLFVSFTRQRGRCTGKPLKSHTYYTVADALKACSGVRGCRAVGFNLVVASGKGGSNSGAALAATLYDASDVVSDSDVPPSARQLTYLRDMGGHAYAVLAEQTLDRAAFPRTTLPSTAGGLSGGTLTVAKAMVLCDAASHGASACAGFVVDLDGASEADPHVSYRVEFRTRKPPTPTHGGGGVPTGTAKPAQRRMSFVRDQAAEKPTPQPKQPDPPPRQEPPRAGGGRGRGGGGGARGGGGFGGGGGGNPFGDFFGGGGGGGNPFGGGGRGQSRGGGGGFGGGFGGQPPRQAPAAKPARDYYAILKVAKTASARQVKKAYHQRAKEWHPDKNRGGDPKRLEKAERNFKLIARAYEILGDRDSRSAYDRGENVDDPKWRPPSSAFS